ncbi:hypothetical protein LTR17_015164 [Elasticomyces elasticus]|nr:hypothetical protein LTR17_015164 [Elasticomyces elasticus]
MAAPTMHVYNDYEASSALRHLTQSAQSNLNDVAANLILYEDTIIRRWKKKSRVKRVALLLEAKPDIHLRKWLMADIHDQLERQPKLPLLKDHDVCLLPLIDLPTLSESPHPLLSLLYTRTRKSPAAWAAYDNEQLDYPFIGGFIKVFFNRNGVTLKDGPNYGTLVPYNRTAMDCGENEGFPRAFAVLQAQKSLSEFLRKTVELILAPGTIKFDDGFDGLAAINSQIASSALTPVYIAPPELSIEAITKACRLRLDAAKKELDKLRTDPYYLRDIIRAVQKSRFSRDQTCEQRQRVMVEVVVRHHSAVECWNILRYAAENIQRKHAGDLVPGADIPGDVDLAIFEFQLLCSGYNNKLGGTMSLSEVMLPCTEYIERNKKDEFGGAPLSWAVGKLGDMMLRNPKQGALDSTQLIGFAGDHLPDHASQYSLNHIFREIYADVVAVDRALKAIRAHRPLVRNSVSKEEWEELPMVHKDQFYAESVIMQGYRTSFPLSELFRPLQALLALPSLKKVTKDSLNNFDAAHRAMSDFWEAFDKTRIEFYNTVKPRSDTVISVACSPRSSECIETLRVTREELEAKVRGLEDHARLKKQSAESVSDLSPPQTTWGTVQTEAVSPASPKEKPKTRPAEGETPRIEDLHIEPPEEQPIEQRFIELTSRHSLDLLQRIYTPGACVKATANVRWEDWLAAMRDAGCEFVDSAGSAVKFVLKGWGTESTVIHKPHDRQTTVDPIKLVIYGKRLHERFGWCYDTFKLR